MDSIVLINYVKMFCPKADKMEFNNVLKLK